MSVPPGTEMFQFPGFASHHYVFMMGSPLPEGLPHSDIHGSKPARGSPWLFAACHVLHRLLMPRHPPNALIVRLIRSSIQVSVFSPQNDPTTKQPSTDCPQPCTEANHSPANRRPRLASSKDNHFHTQLFTNASERIDAAIFGAARIPRTDIQSDLADRGTPRDAPEPDSRGQKNTAPTGHRRARPAAPTLWGADKPPPMERLHRGSPTTPKPQETPNGIDHKDQATPQTWRLSGSNR